jgi:hypothetical protein
MLLIEHLDSILLVEIVDPDNSITWSVDIPFPIIPLLPVSSYPLTF